MKKAFLIFIILIFGSCTFNGCSTINKIPEEKLIFKVALVRGGGWSDTYLLSLKPDGNLEVIFGNRKSDELWNSKNYEIVASGERHLTKEQINDLVTLANEIYKVEPLPQKDIMLSDGIEEIIKINEKIYNYYYDNPANESMRNLVNKLIVLSPIKIDKDNWGGKSVGPPLDPRKELE